MSVGVALKVKGAGISPCTKYWMRWKQLAQRMPQTYSIKSRTELRKGRKKGWGERRMAEIIQCFTEKHCNGRIAMS